MLARRLGRVMGRRVVNPSTPPPTLHHLAIGGGWHLGGAWNLPTLHLHQPRGPEMKLSVEATQDIQADIRRLDAAIDWAERAWGRIV